MSKLFTLLFFLCHFSSAFAQVVGIQTSNSLDAEELVKNVFIKGNCRNVSNITAIGNEELSIGQFNSGANIINVNDGIILSTGAIDLASGPNIDNEAGFSFNLESLDADLDQLATSTLFDVTGIEFDFVPLNDRVSFRYVFASEEYCEFVGTAFNDVFGFFVSGPGINGAFANNAINVASITTLNGTEESVSINNINHLINETFYVDNITTTDAQNCEIPYVPLLQDFIEYDGFTIPLIASFQVIPCETYHIRLVLGDVGDANLDSAVFLQSNSFDLGESVKIRAEVPSSDAPIAYENCVDGQFVFTRNTLGDLNQDLTVDFNISDDSEAINGVDFVEIPLSITIPAGDTSAILPITIIDDTILEGAEKLKLELNYNCDCLDPTLTELIIEEVEELFAFFPEINACANQNFDLAPIISGGLPPFNFLWETGVISDTLTVNTNVSTQYSVTITDFCGNSIPAIANVNVQEIPTATLTGIYDFCEISETGIPVTLEGNPPWSIEYNIDEIAQIPLENIQTNPFYLNVPTEGIYTLTAFSDANCVGNIIGTAEVKSPFAISTNIVLPTCPNSTDGSIEITQLDAVSPFSMEWNIETEDAYFLENLTAGIYTLSIADGDSCLYERDFDLSAISSDIKDCAPVYIPNSFSPNDDGINDVFSIFFDTQAGIEQVVSLQIYSRWGALIFEQTNFVPIEGATDWAGDFRGRKLDTGVYVYVVNLAFSDGSTLVVSGDVSLVR